MTSRKMKMLSTRLSTQFIIRMIKPFAVGLLFIADSFLFLMTLIYAFRCKVGHWFNTKTSLNLDV